MNRDWQISVHSRRENRISFRVASYSADYFFKVDFRDRADGIYATGLWVSPINGLSLEGVYLSAFRELLDWLFARTPAMNVLAGVDGDADMETWSEVLKSTGFAWCGGVDESRVFEIVAPSEPTLAGEASDESPQLVEAATAIFPTWYPVEARFATGSAVKLGQYGWLFRSFGIKVIPTSLAARTPEPQVEGDGREEERILVEDPLRRVARFAALRNAYPLMLEDTMLFIEHFNDDFDSHPILPGPDTKRWWSALGSDGVLRVMANSSHRRAKFVCQLGVLTSDGEYHVFRAERLGHISERVRISAESERSFPYVTPHAFHSIFVPDGAEQTYAELSPSTFRSFDYRSDCAEEVGAFLLERRELDQGVSARLF